VEAAHRDERPRRRRRGEPPLAQRGEEVGDVGLGDAPGVGDPARGEVGRVGPQVAAVGGQRVVGRALLDADVVEPAADVTLDARDDRGRRREGLDGLLGQDSASSSETEAMPWASATPP
jgi:hypothetical protein